MFDLWLRINENNHVDGINTTKHKEYFMYALTFKNKILIKGSYREVLDHCHVLRKEQGYLLSDSRYKLLNLETGESVCQ